MGLPSLPQSSNFATGCDVINRWIIGIRNKLSTRHYWIRVPLPPPEIREQNKNNRAIWLVCRADTNARGFWLVKQTFGCKKTSRPKNFLEINRYFALTSYSNTIGHSNNAFSILGFSLSGKVQSPSPCFDLFIHWLIKQTTNTYIYRNHFSRSSKNHTKSQQEKPQWSNLVRVLLFD